MLRFLTVLLCVALAPALPAQSSKDAQKALRQSLEHQTVYLRNMALGDRVSARWTGTAFEFDSPQGHLFAGLVVDYVKFKGHQVEIDAQRYAVLHSRAQALTLDTLGSSVRIFVDLANANEGVALPQLRDALFFTTLEDARTAVPRSAGGTLKRDPAIQEGLPNRTFTDVDDIHCDCADRNTLACAHKFPAVGLATFHVLRLAEPEFSAIARNSKISGNVLVSFTIDASGHAADLWVLHGVGFGLDEKAIESVQQSSFQPATCHDQPLASKTQIEVNFQSF